MPRYTAPKGNKFATTQKGKPKGKTIIQNKLKEMANWEDAEKAFEKIVMEMLTSKNKKTKENAAKVFGEYIKPKKRENINEFKGNIVLEIHGIQKLPELEQEQKK